MSKQAPYDINKVMNEIKGLRTENLNVNHRKERNPSEHIIVTLKKPDQYGNHKEIVTIDVFHPKHYRTGMERVHCCMWVHDSSTDTHLSGSGWACGCGYHKTSAAIDEAFSSAGIEMQRSFGGCGDSPVRVAIAALMKALGYRKNQYIVTSR